MTRTYLQDTRPQDFHPLARASVWLIFMLAIANGGFLYLLPSLAKDYYAWPIQPAINAAFMGAGYAAGLVATGLALMARRWRSVRTLMPAFFALGLSLFMATLIHAGRFKWDYALTWVWTLVYFLIPFIAAGIWFWHERQVPLETPDPRLHNIRQASLAVGIAVTLLGLVLYLAPIWFVAGWPWPTTPLLARVFAGWYLLVGMFFLTTGLSLRRANEIPIPFLTTAAWDVLSLLLLAIYPESIRVGAGLWIWALIHVSLLVISAWGTWKALDMMRLEGQTL